MDRLNYSTHAIDDLLKFAEITNDDFLRKLNRMLANDLSESIKFMLPEGGRIIQSMDKLNGALTNENFRLPFKKIAIEFAIDQKPQFDEKLGEWTTSVPKRIAFCEATTIHKAFKKYYGKTLDDVKDKDCIVVLPVNYRPTSTIKWFPNVCIGFITGADFHYRDSIMVSKDITMLPLGNQAAALAKSGQYTDNHMSADLSDEINALFQLIFILNCKNIVVNNEPAPIKLNKKRVKSGKTVFFDYKVLTVRQTRKQGKRGNTINSRRSPRTHLRMGHPRVFSNGVSIWINDTTVCGGEFLDKDYKLLY